MKWLDSKTTCLLLVEYWRTILTSILITGTHLTLVLINQKLKTGNICLPMLVQAFFDDRHRYKTLPWLGLNFPSQLSIRKVNLLLDIPINTATLIVIVIISNRWCFIEWTIIHDRKYKRELGNRSVNKSSISRHWIRSADISVKTYTPNKSNTRNELTLTYNGVSCSPTLPHNCLIQINTTNESRESWD